MSRHGRYSYVEAFLQKTMPGITERELAVTKTSLRNKPIMLVAETKTKKEKPQRKGKKRLKVKSRILARPTNSTYDDYESLRVLWKDYISDLLSDYMTVKPGENAPSLDLKNAQEVLLKADYHGADLTVADSPCKSHKGLTGTVLQETRNTFLICTRKNKLIKIPKSKSIFTFEYPKGYLVTIFGSQFCYKPSHRLTKRFTKNPSPKELLR